MVKPPRSRWEGQPFDHVRWRALQWGQLAWLPINRVS